MTEQEKKDLEEEYKMECRSGLKLFAWIICTWVIFGVIILLIFL